MRSRKTIKNKRVPPTLPRGHNDFYIGKVRYGDVKVNGQHEAIISPILFGKVQATLARAKEMRKAKRWWDSDEALERRAWAVVRGE